MANPFLFGDAPSEPQNPFLSNDASGPTEQANPFLMSGGGGGMTMQHLQQNASNFGAQDMGGNPFASFSAPMFGDASAQYYYQQGNQQPFGQPQHQQSFTHSQQQFVGQYGEYPQVIFFHQICRQKVKFD